MSEISLSCTFAGVRFYISFRSTCVRVAQFLCSVLSLYSYGYCVLCHSSINGFSNPFGIFKLYVVGFEENIHKKNDYVYIVHSVEWQHVLHNSKWHYCKYLFYLREKKILIKVSRPSLCVILTIIN